MRRSPGVDAADLAGRVASALPQLDATEQRIAVESYRRLAAGKPVEPDEVARHLDLAPDFVRKYLESSDGVFLDDRSRVVGFWGLALQETPHRFTVDGRRLYTWCAWDSLFLPAILCQTADVASSCPVTGATITLTVRPDRVESCSPAGSVLSFVSPEKPLGRHVLKDFCCHVRFLSSRQAGEAWTAEHDGMLLLTLDEGYEVGRLSNREFVGLALG